MDNQNWVDVTSTSDNHQIEMDANALPGSAFQYRHRPLTFNDPLFDGFGIGAKSTDEWSWGNPNHKDDDNGIARSQ